jgi:hypothetical protein
MITSIGAALGGAAMPLAGTGLLAGLQASAMITQAFAQIAVGVALSAISRMLTPKPKGASIGGTKQSVQFGEDAPATAILGRFATAGDLVYAGSWGDDSELYVTVVELSDCPATLSRVLVNGAWVNLSSVAHAYLGYPVVEYRHKDKDYLWIKFYDGTQTTADSYLLDKFGDADERPWKSDMVGRGIPYAIVTARFGPRVHRGIPQVLYELDGMRLYDPRKDSSVGGAGAQRWNDPSSWTGFGGAANSNPVVQIYNLMLGLSDPITGDPLWGGREISQDDLPLDSWFAAMNECDADASGAEGVELQYRAGVEISFGDDSEPADAIEELLNACQGQIAELAGKWTIHVGAFGSAVYAFTDDDIIVTSPEDFDPFPGLDQTFNGVNANYPEPEDGWQAKEAPKRRNASYLAEDGGRLQVAELKFPSVPYKSQVQRLMASALKDQRRFRRHALVLPPEARAIAPLDVIEWSSARNGYETKLFTVDLCEDLPNGCVAVSLREVDPSDYDFGEDDLLPSDGGYLGRPPVQPLPRAFSVEAATVLDASGTGRRPAIRLNWNPDIRGMLGVRWRVRLQDQPEHVPTLGGAHHTDDDLEATGLEVFAGEPLEVFEGEWLEVGYFAQVDRGTALITEGILPNTSYEVGARYDRPGADAPWSAWMEVTTPDTRLAQADLDDLLNDRISQALDNAEAAAADAAAAVAAASAALDQVEVLAGDTVAQLEDLLDQIAAFDAGDLIAANLLSLRALQTGWNNDPTFQKWSAGPDHWTVSGLSATATQFTGFYGSGLDLDIPSGPIGGLVRAASDVAGQMDAGDPTAEWVVLYALVTMPTGTSTSFRIRPEWKISGTWTRGDMKGLTAPTGSFAQLGIAVISGLQQGIEVLVQKPAGTATAVSVLVEKDSAVTGAAHVQVHLLGLRHASDAEIAAGQAAGNLSAAVSTLNTTIAGVSNALAAAETTLTASINAVSANLTTNYVTVVALDSALAAFETELSADILGEVAAGLSLSYYTRAEVDDGIAEAISAFATTLSTTTIEGLAASFSDEVAARVAGDNALAGRITTIEARKDPGALNANGSFATGSFQGWTGTTALASFTPPPSFTIVARGGTVSAQQNAPSPFMLRAATDASTARGILNERFEAKAGDKVSMTAMYAAGGTSPSVTLRFIVRCLDVSGAGVTGGAFFGEVPAYASTAWTKFTSPVWGPLPANTAYVRVEVQRLAGGAGEAFVTGVDARKVEPASMARISATEAVAASASTAIASLSTAISASFGSQAAFLSEMSTVVARIDLLASTYVLRQRAGAATGHVEAVAFSTPDGTALSTFQLDYDVIDLEGRVSARDLVISSSVNLVPDDQLQVAAIWVQGTEWQLFANTSMANANSIGEVRYIGTSHSGNAVATGLKFPVRAGETLACSFRCRGNGAQYRAYAQLQFFDVAGVPVPTPSTVSFGITLTASAATLAPAAEVVVVPAGAAQACWRWVVDRTQTTSAYVRFSAPTVRRQAGAIEIADGAITAPKINVTDLGAVVATLGTCTITSALNFAPGVVVTGAIGANAVSDIGLSLRSTVLNLASDDTWYDVCSFTVNVPAGAAVLVTGRVAWDRTGLWETFPMTGGFSLPGPDISDVGLARIIRGTSVIAATAFGARILDPSPPTGTVAYRMQVMSQEPSPPSGYAVTNKIQTRRVAEGSLIVEAFKR